MCLLRVPSLEVSHLRTRPLLYSCQCPTGTHHAWQRQAYEAAVLEKTRVMEADAAARAQATREQLVRQHEFEVLPVLLLLVWDFNAVFIKAQETRAGICQGPSQVGYTNI
jgi:hypothetical protein